MKKTLIAAAVAGFAAAPALAGEHASGDAAAGEDAFRQCATCHVVTSPDGETLAGRNAQTGPNLYGIAGRQAGTVEDFRYGDAIVEAGEAGLEWTEEDFVGYVMDPTAYLREYLDDNSARARMSFRVRSEEDALNLYAFLAQFAEE